MSAAAVTTPARPARGRARAPDPAPAVGRAPVRARPPDASTTASATLWERFVADGRADCPVCGAEIAGRPRVRRLRFRSSTYAVSAWVMQSRELCCSP